jgi:hypothetical protein
MRFCLIVALVSVLGSTVPTAAANQPAMEYGSLLNLRFYEQTGGFMLDQLQMVFPPQTDVPMSVEFITAGGQVVASSALRIQRWPEFPAFDGVKADGPGIIQLGKPGDYTMRFKIGEAVATELPFKITAAESGDPFAPQTTYALEGEWSKLAFLALQTDKPNDALTFDWWISTRDVGGGKTRATCNVAIAKGGAAVATSLEVVVTQANSQFLTARLLDPAKNRNFTKANLIAADGAYDVNIVCDGAAVRTYLLTVENGVIKPHPRSALDYQPHTRFLSPRFIDISSRSNSQYKMTEAWWVDAVK